VSFPRHPYNAAMKFLIVSTDYPEFLRWHYGQRPGCQDRSYDEQLRFRDDSLFAEVHACVRNLRKLGHEAWVVHANNEFMQKTWAREHALTVADRQWNFRLRRHVVPWVSRISRAWFYPILAAQIKYYRPDVLLNQAMDTVNAAFLNDMKAYVRLVVGQHAASPVSVDNVRSYDLIVSSFPPTVEKFRKQGVASELNRLGFDPDVGRSIAAERRVFDVTFVGSFAAAVHFTRISWLEDLCRRLPQLKIWAPQVENLSPSSPIRTHYAGQAWGREMYEILHASKITLNHHGDIPPYANNLRLYESTGVGAMLVTDWKDNLHEMFVPGKEIVTYRSAEECAEHVEYYLGHAAEREAIAHAGHQRTLRDHTVQQRMRELVHIVRSYL
jgi:spore maturation protein CgeB